MKKYQWKKLCSQIIIILWIGNMKLKFTNIRESPYFGDMRPFRQFTFAGGINYSMLPTGIDFEKELIDCSNVFVGLDNVLRVRYGTTEWYDSESAKSVKGIGSYEGKLIYATNSKVILETTEIGACSTTGTVTFLNAKGNIYIMDGSTLKRYDGTTLEDVPNAPTCRYGIYHHNRLWVVGDITNPSRLWVSGVNDDEDWGSTGYELGTYVDIDPFDNASITGIGLWFDSIIIFKNAEMPRVYRVDGLPAVLDSELYQASNPLTVTTFMDINNSSINADTIQMTPAGLLFMGRDGIYSLGSKENSIELVSHNINKELMTGSFANTTATTAYFSAYGLYVVASGSVAFVYNIFSKGWFKWDFDEYTISYVSVVAGKLVFGTTAGKVFYWNTAVATDDGEDILATVETGYYTFDSISIGKYVSEAYMMIDLPSSGDVYVTFKPDYAPIYGVAMQYLYKTDGTTVKLEGDSIGGQTSNERKFKLLTESLDAGFDDDTFGFDTSNTLGFDGRVNKPYLQKLAVNTHCVNMGLKIEITGILAALQEIELIFYPLSKAP